MKINTSLRAKNTSLRSGKVLGIVLHDTAGSGTHNDTLYLVNDPEKRGVSVCFTVERNGDIYQLTPDPAKYNTFHAGRSTFYKGARNGQVNEVTVGIELCHRNRANLDTPVWPNEQIEAVAELCVYLCDKFNLEKTDITTHKKIIQDGSRSDPRDFPWDKFWSYFIGHEAQNDQNPESNTTNLHAKIYHKVERGDTLYSLAQKYSTTIEELKALNDLHTNNILAGVTLLVKE